MIKSSRKYAQIPDPDPFLILVNKLKHVLDANNYFKNKIFWKSIIKIL